MSFVFSLSLSLSVLESVDEEREGGVSPLEVCRPSRTRKRSGSGFRDRSARRRKPARSPHGHAPASLFLSPRCAGGPRREKKKKAKEGGNTGGFSTVFKWHAIATYLFLLNKEVRSGPSLSSVENNGWCPFQWFLLSVAGDER
jgi:hypothetical protein